MLARLCLSALLLTLACPAFPQNRNHPGLVHLGDGAWGTPAEAQARGLIAYRGRWLDPKLAKKLAGWEKEDAAGLGWENAYRTDSKYYRLTTNLPRFLVEVEIKPFLDELYQTYVEVFARDFGLKGKGAKDRWIKIYASFEEYSRHEGDGELAGSRLNPGFIVDGDELVTFYEETDPAEFYDTVFHEGAHQFFQSLLPGADLPMWLDEGLATYFEGCTYSRATRTITPGFLPAERLELAQDLLKGAQSSPDLAQHLFMGRSGESFGGEEYALAWSFLYYLAHREQGAAKRMAAFLRELNGSGTKPVDEVFLEATREELGPIEAGWRDYVLALSPGELVHWVLIDVEGAGPGIDLKSRDMVWSLDGVEIYSPGAFDAAWEARPKDRPFEVKVVRCTPGPESPTGEHHFATAVIEPGSALKLRVSSSLSRSGALSD
jgi:hypothetical protein